MNLFVKPLLIVGVLSVISYGTYQTIDISKSNNTEGNLDKRDADTKTYIQSKEKNESFQDGTHSDNTLESGSQETKTQNSNTLDTQSVIEDGNTKDVSNQTQEDGLQSSAESVVRNASISQTRDLLVEQDSKEEQRPTPSIKANSEGNLATTNENVKNQTESLEANDSDDRSSKSQGTDSETQIPK